MCMYFKTIRFRRIISSWCWIDVVLFKYQDLIYLMFDSWCSAHGVSLVCSTEQRTLSKLYFSSFRTNFTHHDLNIENLPQNLKNKTLPRILKCLWQPVTCVPAFLNVIGVMTDTKRQNGAIKCM